MIGRMPFSGGAHYRYGAQANDAGPHDRKSGIPARGFTSELVTVATRMQVATFAFDSLGGSAGGSAGAKCSGCSTAHALWLVVR